MVKLVSMFVFGRLEEALIILTVIAAGINLALPYILPGSGNIYVSTERGSDWNLGFDPKSPLKTIQTAVDRAKPGDTINIEKGVYRETVHLRRGGIPGKPVMLKAIEPGTVTVSNMAPSGMLHNLDWKDEGDGIFSAKPPWNIHSIRVDDMATYHSRWGGLPALKGLLAQAGKWPLSVQDNETDILYLYLPSGKSPEDFELSTHQKIPPPREWYNFKSANFWLEADHVVIEGLQFDFGVGAGIRLWNSNYVTIRDCAFQGAWAGVEGSPHLHSTSGLVLESSVYDNYPQYHWRKAGMTWADVYRHYSNYSLISNAPSGAIIRSNIVAHYGDGVGVLSTGHDDDSPLLIEGNLFFRGTDDAFEIEGEARNVWVEHNLVYDTHESLGLSPVTVGPVTIKNNLFLHPSEGVNGAQIKLLAGPRNGQPAETIRNITIENNVFVGNWLSWWSDTPNENLIIRDNFFQVLNAKSPPFPPGTLESGNDIRKVTAKENQYPALKVLEKKAESRVGLTWLDSGIPFLKHSGPAWLNFKDLPATEEIYSQIGPELLAR